MRGVRHEGVEWKRRLVRPEGQQRIVCSVDGGEEGPHPVDLGNVACYGTKNEGDEGVIEAELDGPLEGGRNALVNPGEGVCYGRHRLVKVTVSAARRQGA